MQVDEFLLPIFVENIGSASAVPFLSSLTLEAMQHFGGYDMSFAALIALGGLVIGCMVSWLIGWSIAKLRDKVSFLGTDKFPEVVRFFNRYGFLLAALFWMPLGAAIVVITGFFRAPLWKITLAAAFGGGYFLKDYFLA